MKIKKITIENFKSIDKMEFELENIGNSYTSIFVGINESGKSNILKAMSYFEKPTGEFSFLNLCNQKNEDAEYIDLYFQIEFDNHDIYRNVINKKIETDKEIEFKISEIVKNVYLSKESKEFEENYEYKITLPNQKLFFSKLEDKVVIASKNDESNSLSELTNEEFNKLFENDIINTIKKNETSVSFWTPSPEYLLSEVNLLEYKENIYSNKPLRNIFYLAGIDSIEKIKSRIENISNAQQRSKLVSVLQDALNHYLSKKWKHDIDFIIDITETGMFSLSIKDKGDNNKHDRFSIADRSEGAKHFLSLILSLSIEANNNHRSNQLILIDEPEQHLHPSGIRDLSNELLNIGKKNFVFVATHSPFLIDKKNKTRHYIIKKNSNAITQKSRILEHQNLIDDEVLREAFGVEVYSDLINPHSLLVEGASDKAILQKAFHTLDHSDIGITNGHGSNIDKIAAKLNYDNISILVVVDDDSDGKNFKSNILKIAGIYTNENVFTLRDLVGTIINEGTIEDLLEPNYILAQFKKNYKDAFNEDIEFDIKVDTPVIRQIIIFLKQKKKFNEWDMDLFKTNISKNFKPNKTSLKEKNPLLYQLAKEIIRKLNK